MFICRELLRDVVPSPRYLIVKAIRAVKTAYVRDSNCADCALHLCKRDMIARLLMPFESRAEHKA